MTSGGKDLKYLRFNIGLCYLIIYVKNIYSHKSPKFGSYFGKLGDYFPGIRPGNLRTSLSRIPHSCLGLQSMQKALHTSALDRIKTRPFWA